MSIETVEYPKNGFPIIKVPVTGRPLPKGMSKCIKGFIVNWKTKTSEEKFKIQLTMITIKSMLKDENLNPFHKIYYEELLKLLEDKLEELA